MKLIISQAAVSDLERLYSFLAKNDLAAAGRAAVTLESAIQSLDMLRKSLWLRVWHGRETQV